MFLVGSVFFSVTLVHCKVSSEPVTVHFENNFSTNSGLEFTSFTRTPLAALALRISRQLSITFIFIHYVFCDKCFLGMSFALVPYSLLVVLHSSELFHEYGCNLGFIASTHITSYIGIPFTIYMGMRDGMFVTLCQKCK